MRIDLSPDLRIGGFGQLGSMGAFAGSLSDCRVRVKGATAVEDDEEQQKEDGRNRSELDHGLGALGALDPHLMMSVCVRLSVMADPVRAWMNGVIGLKTSVTAICIGQPLTRLPSQPATIGLVIVTLVTSSTPVGAALTAACLIPGSSNGFMPAYRAAANAASRIERSK